MKAEEVTRYKFSQFTPGKKIFPFNGKVTENRMKSSHLLKILIMITNSVISIYYQIFLIGSLKA